MCGTVFKVQTRYGSETVLYKFCKLAKCADGDEPEAGLIADKSGNLYGTTVYGGANECFHNSYRDGTVFELAPSGTETVLYSFGAEKRCPDGFSPLGGLIPGAKSGNLYGTTWSRCGTVFKLTPTGTETVLHAFNGSDGCSPAFFNLIMVKGYLYGVTLSGGNDDGRNGGVVFKVGTDGG